QRGKGEVEGFHKCLFFGGSRFRGRGGWVRDRLLQQRPALVLGESFAHGLAQKPVQWLVQRNGLVNRRVAPRRIGPDVDQVLVFPVSRQMFAGGGRQFKLVGPEQVAVQ